MTRKLIDDMREVILPFVKEVLLKTNYEGLGKSDAKVFERDFNEILNLAIKALEQEPTTPNDCETCIHNKGVLECDMYGCKYEPHTKNDLSSGTRKNSKKLEKDFGELDCISRADAIRVASGYCHPSNVAKELAKLPSVTPQEPQTFKWCTDCREYDQEKHCCHRWSKVIRDTVEEMKQEYIEREVLDKIRAEISTVYESLDGYDPDSLGAFVSKIDEILDKYKAETEGT